MWESYYNIPKAIFYLLKGHYRVKGLGPMGGRMNDDTVCCCGLCVSQIDPASWTPETVNPKSRRPKSLKPVV